MMILKTDETWFSFWSLKVIVLQSPFDIDTQDMNIKGAYKKLENVKLDKNMYFNITLQNFEHFLSNIFFPVQFLWSCQVKKILSHS